MRVRAPDHLTDEAGGRNWQNLRGAVVPCFGVPAGWAGRMGGPESKGVASWNFVHAVAFTALRRDLGMQGREVYRLKALACLEVAEKMHDPDERDRMLRIARGYLKLARHVARQHNRGTAHRSDQNQNVRPDS